MEKDRNTIHLPVGVSTFEEYWQEFSSFEETGHLDEDEDEAAKTPDEGEAEEEWLREAGFETLVNNEAQEDEMFNGLLSTLTARQRDVVLRRLQTLELSKKKKKHKSRQRADVRQLFNCQSYDDRLTSVDSEPASLQPSLNSLYCEPSNPISEDLERYPVHRGSSKASQEDQQKISKSASASVLPQFLRTGHSGGFSLRDHSKAIDTDGRTSVEVLRYETRTSVIQEKCPSLNSDRSISEATEISFQGISSRLDPSGESQEKSVNDRVGYDYRNHVPVSELNEEDRTQLRSLAVIEVTALLEGLGLVPPRRRKRHRKKGKENVVIGASLTTILELDRRRCPGIKIPLIYQWVLHHLHEKGLTEEGLLRLAGSVQKIEALKAECEKHYLSQPIWVENSIHQSSVNDVAVMLKQLIRQLPEPLLTNSHMDTFLQVPNIETAEEQVNALNLMVLALPDTHRELLQELLYFLSKVSEFEAKNRMSLANVAMIMAPNLFPPPRLKKNNHKSNDLEAEVTIAALSSKVTQLLIKYSQFLGMVPKELLAQARLQSQYSSKKQVKRSRGRKAKTDKLHPIGEAILSANGHGAVIRVHPPTSLYCVGAVPVAVNERTTAGEVIQKVAKILDLRTDLLGHPSVELQENKAVFFQRPRTESEPTAIHRKCLVGANSGDCLRGHALYYMADNIGERKLQHEDSVLGADTTRYRSHSSSWAIRCNH